MNVRKRMLGFSRNRAVSRDKQWGNDGRENSQTSRRKLPTQEIKEPSVIGWRRFVSDQAPDEAKSWVFIWKAVQERLKNGELVKFQDRREKGLGNWRCISHCHAGLPGRMQYLPSLLE